MTTAEVTAVIPTLVTNPDRLTEAVESVFGQDEVDMEAVVVIDGPPIAEVPAWLTTHPGVRLVQRPVRQGGGAARNDGVGHVRTEWVAFLDDDDVWFPGKIHRQLAVARASEPGLIVSSRLLLVLDDRPERPLPASLFEPDTDVGDYLLCLDRSLQVGILQTSTLLMSTALAREVPFTQSAGYFEDVDWLLRATKLARARIVQLPDVLSVWRLDSDASHVSQRGSWRDAVSWSKDVGELLSPRARAGAILAGGSRKSDARRAAPLVVWHAFRVGHPSVRDLIAGLFLLVVPERVRRSIARLRSSRPSRAPVR